MPVRLLASVRRPGIIISLAILAALSLPDAAVSDGRPGIDPGPMTRAQASARAEALAVLGRQMFFDRSLSASGRQSCSSCHDPVHAFGPPNARSVQPGGPALDQTGFRAAPSLRYLQSVPQFSEHFFDPDDEADESVDNGPTGGLDWDGRADRSRDQARFPLLSPFEMANADSSAVSAKLSHASYADGFRHVFGASIFDRADAAFRGATEALDAFEQTPSLFYPYSSRYDAYLAGKTSLTPLETRGLQVFNDPVKGNCASCHVSGIAHDGEPPQFSDFGYLALGVPRNRAIAANADPRFVDLGLCGPLRSDLQNRPEYCGLFRTPSLRNVAIRQSFFHNGIFHTLREAVAFYATRDTDPGRWYPRRSDGAVDAFDDLPPRYRDNLNRDTPFGGKPGGQATMTDADIDAVVAFLQTLTDRDVSPQQLLEQNGVQDGYKAASNVPPVR